MVKAIDGLEQLLSADAESVRREARAAWTRLRGKRSIVLHGAGGLGRRALAAMRQRGDNAVAFSDNRQGGTGATIDGIPVLTPASAVEQYPDAVFVITIWGANSPHRQAHSREQLCTLGAEAICSFPLFAWHYESALPHYLVASPEGPLLEPALVRSAFHLLSDTDSQREFVDQLRLRITGEFDHLASPVAHPQYFPPDLVNWRGGEVVFDGGAYDGDSLRAWAQWRGNDFARWIAVEPDPLNRVRLTPLIAALPAEVQSRVIVQDCALGAVAGSLILEATGTAGSTVASTGAVNRIEVAVRPADSLDQHEPISFFKLDIEGAELEALEGASQMIARGRPVLAISAYHRQDHLWRVPLACAALLPESTLHLRPHNEEGWDLVCYAVPNERQGGR
jgi:FkbM family methyltransferase